MKIVLANCPPWTEKTPPINLGYLTAYLREKGHEVFPFDFNIEAYTLAKAHEKYIWSRDLDGRWIKDKLSFLRREINRWTGKILKTKAKVIGITVIYDSISVCIELAKEIKKRAPDKIIIFGGPHCHRGFISKEFLKHNFIDIFVIGEGEETLNQVLNKLEKDKQIDFCQGTIIRKKSKGLKKSSKKSKGSKESELIDCGDRPPINNLDSIPFPDYSDLPLDKYSKRQMIPILGSRGCISKCTFCQDPNNIRTYRSRSGKNIFEEMELRYKQGYREFYFNDLLMNGNTKALHELCDLLKKTTWHKHINLGGQMKARKEMTFELYKKLREVGCHQVMFGIESGSQEILNKMNKGTTVEANEKNIQDCAKAGILVEIALIVGFPGETEETFAETIKLIKNNYKYIDTIAALYALDLRIGSHVSNNIDNYDIIREKDIWYWHTKDKNNTFEWRLRLIYDVIKTANELGIKLGFDDAHFYFYHALRYYHIYKKQYDKSFDVMNDALQYLSTKVKKYQNKMLERDEIEKRLKNQVQEKENEIAELQSQKNKKRK